MTSATSGDRALTVTTLRAPDPATREAVLALAERVTRADGTEPLSEDARLAARGAPLSGDDERAVAGVVHVLAHERGGLVGYAQARTEGPGASGELLVDPAHRGRGVGGRLAAELEAAAPALSDGPLLVWSHGDMPAAAALAARRGYSRSRELWHMSRTLGAGSALPAVPTVHGVRLRTFVAGQDEAAWLTVNSRAFSDHPEQGRWGSDDLAARKAETWFDAEAFLLAVDADDTLLGFHWTKVEPGQATSGHGTRGEVYVVGVDPSAQGRGIGPLLTLAGLHHLASVGVAVAELYVDGDNVRAQHTYTRLGFTRDGTDVQYRLDATSLTPARVAPP